MNGLKTGSMPVESTMSYGFLECPRCQSTVRPADQSADGGQWVCYECGLEFLSDEEPGGYYTRSSNSIGQSDALSRRRLRVRVSVSQPWGVTDV